MDCRDVKEHLSEYVDEMLPEKEASEIKDHLARCADCLGEYESTLKIIKHMNEMETIDAPAEFLEKVTARLEKRFSFGGWLRRLFVPLRVKLPLELAGIAAAVALLVYVFGVRDGRDLYEVTISMSGERGQTIVVPEKPGEKRDEPKRRDKKGGERSPSLEEVIRAAGWRIVSTERCEDSNIPASMIVELPADEYQDLLGELNRLGVVETRPSPVFEEEQDVIKVKIVVQNAGP
ncbi:MAG: zf-HC2 domain-containing protein [Candidatus Latescibacterota bacterium]|nr:MAG: zf-HC2 domain-containing protein [Candidatus Latescibacterota bacterium]